MCRLYLYLLIASSIGCTAPSPEPRTLDPAPAEALEKKQPPSRNRVSPTLSDQQGARNSTTSTTTPVATKMGPAANTTTGKSRATDALTEEQTAAIAEQHAFMLATSGSATPSANAAPQDSGVERAEQRPSPSTHHPKAPIDCPLRKAGIDPHGLKPFAQVEKYIAFLERADRAEWQKPDAVLKALNLSP